MSIEDASRCVEGSIELYIELYIEDVEARAQLFPQQAGSTSPAKNHLDQFDHPPRPALCAAPMGLPRMPRASWGLPLMARLLRCRFGHSSVRV